MVAGILKLHEFLTVSPFVPSTGFIPHRLIFAVAMVEIILSLHLFLQKANPWTWFLAIVLFTVFAVLNIAMIVRGVAVCECFGSLTLSPWIALAIDGLSLTSLVWVGMSNSTLTAQWVDMLRPRRNSISITVLILVVIACGIRAMNAHGAILNFLVPARKIAARSSPDSCTANPAQRRELVVTIDNRTTDVVTLLGKQGICGIRFDGKFPVRIPALGQVAMQGYFVAKQTEGVYTLPAVLITDSPTVPFVVVTLRVTVPKHH